MSKPIQIKNHSWYTTEHHNPSGGFHNPWPLPPVEEEEDKTSMWRFMAKQFLGRKDQRPAPAVPSDQNTVHEPVDLGSVQLTWLGHSTVLIQYTGITVITDPVLAKRVGPLELAGPKRETPIPLMLESMPPVDFVALSHNHYDHLDPKVLRFFQQRDAPAFFVPLGVEAHLPKGAQVTVFDWNQYIDINGFRIHCLPARHFSGRTLWDRDKTLWASWFIEPHESNVPSVYYAADTGYAPHFADIREALSAPDVVLMPIGAYRPRWMMRPVHVDPTEALQALSDLGSKTLIPIHWGTYDLAEELLHEPVDVLVSEAEEAGLSSRIEVSPVGGQVLFTGG